MTAVSATSGTVRISSSSCTARRRSSLEPYSAEASVRVRIGTSSIECGFTSGGSAPGGIWSMPASSLACTRVTLRSWSSPTRNRTVTSVNPSPAIE